MHSNCPFPVGWRFRICGRAQASIRKRGQEYFGSTKVLLRIVFGKSDKDGIFSSQDEIYFAMGVAEPKKNRARPSTARDRKILSTLADGTIAPSMTRASRAVNEIPVLVDIPGAVCSYNTSPENACSRNPLRRRRAIAIDAHRAVARAAATAADSLELERTERAHRIVFIATHGELSFRWLRKREDGVALIAKPPMNSFQLVSPIGSLCGRYSVRIRSDYSRSPRNAATSAADMIEFDVAKFTHHLRRVRHSYLPSRLISPR